MATDFVILGGGIIGLASAHALLKLGATVTVLERDRCGREASWAGGGILSPLLPWDYADAVTQLAQLSGRLFPEWVEALRQETGIDPQYRVCGLLALSGFPGMAARERGMENEQAAAWCARAAVPLHRVQAREIAPELADDAAALWLPAVAQVRNSRLLQALTSAVALAGGNLVEGAEATGWRVAHGRIAAVATRSAEYRAGDYIVAAGAWSRQLLGEHALGLAIRPVRGQMLLFKARPGLLRTIVLLDDFYLIPRLDGHILAGSTLEEVGFDKRTTAAAREMLLAKAHALLPALTAETLVGHWAGLRPGSPANIPVIDRHPAIANLYLNSGHHRYGITLAPASAQLLTSLILDQPPPLDAAPYRWPT